jgi:radical SAM-linked protein
MQSDPQASASGTSLPAAAPPERCKYRLRFRKTGDLRLVSHHDLMHCFERMFRRAALPIQLTQGFNPRPRLWFAQSLALGVAGQNEVLELELTESLPCEELHRRLGEQCPPGLAVLAVKRIELRASARVRRALYRMSLVAPMADLPQRCAAFMSGEHHWIERSRPHRRRLDIRPFVGALRACGEWLEMALWVTPYGAARPEEVALALGLQGQLEAGAVFARTDLELEDESTSSEPPPAGLPTQPGNEKPGRGEGAASRERERPEKRPESARAAAQPTALITGPMSFDS